MRHKCFCGQSASQKQGSGIGDQRSGKILNQLLAFDSRASLAKCRHTCHSSISSLLSTGNAVTLGVTAILKAGIWPSGVTLCLTADGLNWLKISEQHRASEPHPNSWRAPKACFPEMADYLKAVFPRSATMCKPLGCHCDVIIQPLKTIDQRSVSMPGTIDPDIGKADQRRNFQSRQDQERAFKSKR